MNLKRNKYWFDIEIAVMALQDTKASNRRLKTTTVLKNFAIDITKDNMQSRIFTSGYRTADAFLRFAYNQHLLLKNSVAYNAVSIQSYVHTSLNFSKKEEAQIPENA